MLHLEAVSHQRGNGSQSFTLEVPELKVHKGEIIALTGVSGSGKSTLLEIIGLILKPDSTRRFALGNNDITSFWTKNQQRQLSLIRSRQLGFVLQTGGLLPYLSVLDNITLSRRLLGLKLADDFVFDICSTLGISHLLQRKPMQLSIGERQRTAIARALVHRPELLLADEPTAALDPCHAEQVMELLIKLTQQLNFTSIIVTHEWHRVKELGLREIKIACSSRDDQGTLAILSDGG
jgi:putative ABC transport system ATP-binding protein